MPLNIADQQIKPRHGYYVQRHHIALNSVLSPYYMSLFHHRYYTARLIITLSLFSIIVITIITNCQSITIR